MRPGWGCAHAAPGIVALAGLLLGCGSRDGDRADEGRVPACFDDEGMDLFAVEADGALGLSWNNHSGQAASGGYLVRFGAREPSSSERSDCTQDFCEHTLRGLDNDVTLEVEVDALDEAERVLVTSCRIRATPRPMAFGPDGLVASSASSQTLPSLTGALSGKPLFLAWDESGGARLTRSDDLGDTWANPETLPGGGSATKPQLAFLDRFGEDEASILFAGYVSDGQIYVVAGSMVDGPTGPVAFGEPVALGAGDHPALAVGTGEVYAAFEGNGGIALARSTDLGRTWSAPARVDPTPAGGVALAPAIAVHPQSGEVYVAWHGRPGPGDDDVYLVRSLDGGSTFSETATRVDDDPGGQNQRFVSLAVDPRSGVLSATWEDRRGGANVYFAQSEDRGASFGDNVDTGAGLGGDQFTPRAVIDAGRNVYVLFIDTSSGRRPLFSRLNPDGTFDPPLEVSSEAGRAGAVAAQPTVFVDRYGAVFTAWSEDRGQDPAIYFARAD